MVKGKRFEKKIADTDQTIAIDANRLEHIERMRLARIECKLSENSPKLLCHRPYGVEHRLIASQVDDDDGITLIWTLSSSTSCLPAQNIGEQQLKNKNQESTCGFSAACSSAQSGVTRLEQVSGDNELLRSPASLRRSRTRGPRTSS